VKGKIWGHKKKKEVRTSLESDGTKRRRGNKEIRSKKEKAGNFPLASKKWDWGRKEGGYDEKAAPGKRISIRRIKKG